jgi:predicted porin
VQQDPTSAHALRQDAQLNLYVLETLVKRTVLTLTVVAGVCSAAFGQVTPPTVTVYGIVDAGVTHTTGLANKKNQVVSGIMEGSRVGLRGNEDIGGGFRALFTIEHRLEINNGTFSNRPPTGAQVPDRLGQASLLGLPTTLQPAVSLVSASLGQTIGVNVDQQPGRFWDRQAYVGLVTPVGAILLGRQYTPAYEVSATFDTMGTQSSLAVGQVAAVPSSIDIRASNALQYRIVLGGLTASAMYALGDNTANTKANRFGGGMVMYKSGPYAVGLAYNQRNNDIGQKSLRSTVLGASMDVGPGTVYGQYAQVKDDNPSGVSGIGGNAALVSAVGATGAALMQTAFTEALRQDGTVMHLGYKLPLGSNTLYVAYSAWNDKRPSNADVASYGAVYTYALSKRTDLNAVLTHFNNKNLAQAAPGQAGFLGGFTKSAGTDSNNVALGIRHRF